MVTNKQYIGKKTFWFLRKSPKGGKRIRRESDWQEYYGSCEALKADIKSLGQDKFKREILRLCKTRGESGFFELREQFMRGVLISDGFYNEAIGKWRTRYQVCPTFLTQTKPTAGECGLNGIASSLLPIAITCTSSVPV
jgi:hypothetical protein